MSYKFTPVTTVQTSTGVFALDETLIAEYQVTETSITADIQYVNNFNVYGLQILDVAGNVLQSSATAGPGSDSMAHPAITGLNPATQYRCRCWASDDSSTAPTVPSGGGGGGG